MAVEEDRVAWEEDSASDPWLWLILVVVLLVFCVCCCFFRSCRNPKIGGTGVITHWC